MAEIYGHRWTSAYGDDAGDGAGLTWGKGLAGLTPEQIGAGVSGALRSADPWPPTLPQFRAMCLEIPSLAAVLADLSAESARRQPFTRLVWGYVDSYRYRHAPTDQAERMIRGAYEQAREWRMNGGPLPDPVLEIVSETGSEPPAKKASDDVVLAALNEARQALS